MIKTMLDSTPAIIQLPIGAEEDFTGVIDLVKMQAIEWIGADAGETGASFTETPLAEWNRYDEFAENIEKFRAELVELAVEQDEEALMEYLDGVEPSEEKLIECIRTGTLAGAFVPTLTGTAFKNKGVQQLLDAVTYYMPAPTDVEAIKGTDLKGETE